MKNIKLILALFVVIAIFAGTTNVEADNPSLKVSVSNYNPLPAVPGRTVDIWVNIQNVGSDEATDVEVEFVDSAVFKLLSENDRVQTIPVLGTRNDKIITYTVEVADGAPEGSNELLLRYSFDGVSVETKLYIDVKSTEAPITISNVELEPDMLVPGSSSTLSIFVKNLAKSTSLKDVTVNLGLTPVVSATAILIDYPFVPVGSANQKTVDFIRPGQTAEIQFELAAYPDATSQLYKLPVTLSFYDDSGENYNESVLIGIEVNSGPDILTFIESSELNTKVLSGNVNFEFTNKGLSEVKLMTVTLKESDDYEILSPSNKVYIGNIDSDDFETARFEVKVKEAKDLKYELEIEYKDALNNKFVENVELDYKIKEAPSNGGSPVGTIIAVLVIVGVGVFIYFRRKKNKKRRQG